MESERERDCRYKKSKFSPNHNTIMASTTPWDRLMADSGSNGQYVLWLGNRQIDANEYNGASVIARRILRSQFEKEANTQQLQLFELLYDSIPTGSSGVPHIPENLTSFPPRDFLCVVKKNDALGGYERFKHDHTYYKRRMPNSNNETLYMLKELEVTGITAVCIGQ
jgi:hypothetical protein